MEPQTLKKKAGAKRRRALPPDYICIAPIEAPLVFDWLNGVGIEADKEVAAIHLRLCFHCQEAVAHSMRIDEKFRARAGRCLHLSIRSQEKLSPPEGDRENGESETIAADPKVNNEPTAWSMKVAGQS